MPIPSQAEYERNERKLFIANMREVDAGWKKLSLADRHEGEADFHHAMAHDPGLVAERVGWILNGSYGKGAYDAAHEVLANKRMNREAWLTHTIGVIEWQIPQQVAVRAWKRLTVSEQKTLDLHVRRAMKDAASN
jgi:hypothetical protein